jgi:hypothetical protein
MSTSYWRNFVTPVSQSVSALIRPWTGRTTRLVTHVKYTCPPGLFCGAVQTMVACTLSLLSPCVTAAHSGRPFVLEASSHVPTHVPVATSLAWRKNPRNMSPLIVTGTNMLNMHINVASLGNARVA